MSRPTTARSATKESPHNWPVLIVVSLALLTARSFLLVGRKGHHNHDPEHEDSSGFGLDAAGVDLVTVVWLSAFVWTASAIVRGSGLVGAGNSLRSPPKKEIPALLAISTCLMVQSISAYISLLSFGAIPMVALALALRLPLTGLKKRSDLIRLIPVVGALIHVAHGAYARGGATALLPLIILVVSLQVVEMISTRLSASAAARRQTQSWLDINRDTITLCTSLLGLTLASVLKIFTLVPSPSHVPVNHEEDRQESHIALLVMTVVLGTCAIASARSPSILPTIEAIDPKEAGLSGYAAQMAVLCVLQLMLWGKGVGFADALICLACGISFLEQKDVMPAPTRPKLGRHVSQAYAPVPIARPSTSASLIRLTPASLRATMKHILGSPESSRIFYFLLLNLAYMVIQVFWGVWTNSLGLISDAIHMAFDCAALGIGLFASVMAEWEPNARFTYGYGRIQTLSGFANGVFLILISIFIIFEAIQRVIDPPEMENIMQLLIVSAGGLGINLWGLFATGHHHHHGHHHGHDHGHDHAHGHSHRGDSGTSHNMRGVYLHVLADTLGSVGVIVSSILIELTGWTGFDPIASLLIAGLIVASVVPLVMDSAKVLCLELSLEKTTEVRNALSELSTVEGLESYAAPRFWPKDESTIIGSIHIQLAHSKSGHDTSRPASEAAQVASTRMPIYTNAEKVASRVEKVLYSKIQGLCDLHIQIEGCESTFCPCMTAVT